MKLTVQIRLLPTPAQAAALEATLHACNEAATWASEVAFEKGVKRNLALREHICGEIRARWNLGAQAAQHVVKKTRDAYTTLKANLKAGNLGRPGSGRYRKATAKPIAFRPEGAQPYDEGAGRSRRSGVHLPHLRRMRAPRQREPGLPGLVRVPVMRIR